MKILFLDIDGVLNSMRSAVAFHTYPSPGQEDFLNGFDMVAVCLIQTLQKKTGCRVVLSSTWRHDKNWRDIGRHLGIPFLDRTPVRPGPRGGEIERWLENNKGFDGYAIVDDDSDMLPEQLPFFVKTDPRNGLTLENYDRLLELLT